MKENAPSILICWIGKTDLDARAGIEQAGVGPIAQAVEARQFDRVFLLSDYPKPDTSAYREWLAGRTAARVEAASCPLSGPTHFGEIYEAASHHVQKVLEEGGTNALLTFHLSPGTPAMAAVWIILAKTRFRAELIESSRQHGVRSASVPFDLSAEYIPDLLRRPDETLERLTAGLPPEAPEFDQIIHRSEPMKRLVARARRVAPHSIPVLIEGASGTGKELLARAIHQASPRRAKTLIAVNCGAIPADLVESELFGHKKGAFTGATTDRVGYFQAATGGTLFLDEVGELPPPAQVKLLRVLQDGEITPVGVASPVKVDVRIVAATNRNLLAEVAKGTFREDLFFRLAVAVLKVPPLRDRAGDIGLLIDRMLETINIENEGQLGIPKKKLSPSARSLMLQHPWPGNVRELLNTLRRAVVWSAGDTITVEDMRESLLLLSDGQTDIMNRPLGDGFDIQVVVADVARHYLLRAITEAGGNKTEAARLVGLPSYQTLNNWLRRYTQE